MISCCDGMMEENAGGSQLIYIVWATEEVRDVQGAEAKDAEGTDLVFHCNCAVELDCAMRRLAMAMAKAKFWGEQTHRTHLVLSGADKCDRRLTDCSPLARSSQGAGSVFRSPHCD